MSTSRETIIYEARVDDDASKTFDSWSERFKDVERNFDRTMNRMGNSMSSGFQGLPALLTSSLVNPFLGAFSTIVGAAGKAFGAVAGFIGDTLVDATQDSIELEDAMAGVRKTAGLTAEQVFLLQREVRDYSVNALGGMISANELAAALEVAGQQGVFAGKNFEQASQDALVFAKTMTIAGDVFGGLTTEKAAEGLGLLHGTFSDIIPDIERAASVINFFGDTTKRSEGFILTLSGRLAQAGKNLGITEAATIGIAATLGELTQQASTSGRAMSRIFDIMRRDSAAWAQAFGLNVDEFSTLIRTDAAAALQLFADRVNELQQTDMGMDQLLTAMKDMSVTGDAVSNVIKGLGTFAGDLEENLRDAEIQWQENTSAMNSFIAGTDRVSKLWDAFKTILTNTIGVMSDQLLPVFKILLKDINALATEFRTWLLETGFIENTLVPALAHVQQIIQDLVRQAVQFVKNADWGAILAKTKKGFDAVVDTAKGLWEMLVSIVKVWRELSPLLGPTLDIVIKGMEVFADATAVVAEVVDTMVEAFGDALNAVIQFATTGLSAIKTVISVMDTLVTKIWDATKAIIGLGDEATGRSTFPDMHEWTQKDIVAMDGLTRSVNETTAAVVRAGAASTNAMAQIGSLQAGRPVGVRSSSVTAQTRSAAPPPGSFGQPPAQSGGSTSFLSTVIFQGPNVVDETSKSRFVTDFTKAQKEMSLSLVGV